MKYMRALFKIVFFHLYRFFIHKTFREISDIIQNYFILDVFLILLTVILVTSQAGLAT